MHPPAHSIEEHLIVLVQWLKLGVESVGVGLVVAGVVAAVAQFARIVLGNRQSDFNAIRLTLARYLTLALEFQLGADILGTSVSPDWDQIGKLGAVAVIRTGLNHFLSVEMKHSEARDADSMNLENPQPERRI